SLGRAPRRQSRSRPVRSRVMAPLSRSGRVELHLHLEGAASARTLVGLSRRSTTAIFPDLASVEGRRRDLGSPGRFLAFYRDVCRVLRSPADYARLAGDLVRHLRRGGVAYAEVYVSPAIVEKIGLDWHAVAEALERRFAAHERSGGRIRVLLDSVRHWGPAAAERVLDLQ